MSNSIPTDEEDESRVDNVSPTENGAGQDAAGFSADAQRAKFRDSVGGSSDSSPPNLPGGPYNPRPITVDGITYDPFSPPKLYINPDGTTEFRGGTPLVDAADQNESELKGVPGLDAARLKGIYEKCVAKYEGKYTNGLLDVNVALDETDRAEIKQLLDMAKSVHAGFTNGNSDWERFVGMRQEMRAIVGDFGENSRIIEDNSVQTPTKAKENDRPLIKVPTSIYRLNMWDSKIGGLDQRFDRYQTGNARGEMASGLGEDIKDVYRFVKESQTPQGTTNT